MTSSKVSMLIEKKKYSETLQHAENKQRKMFQQRKLKLFCIFTWKKKIMIELNIDRAICIYLMYI